MENLKNNSIINWELYHKIYGDKEMKLDTEIKKFDFKESDNIYMDIMNDEIASDIKKWRVTEEYSWRAVHREFQYKYIPEEKWFVIEGFKLDEKPTGNQIDGMELCHAAMIYLNESVSEGWN